jgi:serine protease Do
VSAAGVLGGRLTTSALAVELEALAALVRRATVRVEIDHAERGGAGSGVIWSADGLIVTNAHVARAQRAVVRLADGERLDARVIRRDPRRDLAALAVDAHGLAAPPIGDSRALRVGELVLALGSPWGVPNQLAVGIVQARSPRDADAERWVRADVRLAPGNSGGPLADVRGRVVGINTMIVGGLGVAIATAEVTAFLRDLDAARRSASAA